tara:strand:- start:126 stop:881 length:756 start_codon:yes stop_codon:yes gene_type:complete
MKKKSKQKSHGTTRKKIEGIPSGNPEDFVRRCDDLINLCEIINDQNETNQQLLKNFIKIRLVSIVEFNLKGFVSELIDIQNLNPKDILDKNSIEIDLDVLQNFENVPYTKGKIVVAHLDKMNPGIVYTIMNNINKLDTFKWIDKILNKDSGTCFTFFKDLYKDRNDLTHNLTDTFETSKTLTTNIGILRTMIFALFTCTHCNIDMLHKKLPESIIEREYGLRLKKLRINQNKFKDITLKFKKEYKPSYKKY